MSVHPSFNPSIHPNKIFGTSKSVTSVSLSYKTTQVTVGFVLIIIIDERFVRVQQWLWRREQRYFALSTGSYIVQETQHQLVSLFYKFVGHSPGTLILAETEMCI